MQLEKVLPGGEIPADCSNALRESLQEVFCKPPSTTAKDAAPNASTSGDTTGNKPAPKSDAVSDRPQATTKSAEAGSASGTAKDKPSDSTPPGEKKTELPPNYAKLVEQLGSDIYREREHATATLRRSGPDAVPLVVKALSDGDPERVRRAQGIVQSMIRTFDMADLMKSPDLLPHLPHSSLEDRRASVKKYLEDNPADNSFKTYFGQLANEAEFLRRNPQFVADQLKMAQQRAVDERYPDYTREAYQRYSASLQKLDSITGILKVDAIVQCTDAEKRRQMAIEAITTHPGLVQQYEQKESLQSAGLMQDPEFADLWVLKGGDPRLVGKHKNFAQIEKLLEQRLAEQQKLAGGKPTNGVAQALQTFGEAHERQGNNDKAIKFFRDAINAQTAVNPADQSIRGNLVYLGNYQARTNKLEDAIKSFEEVAKFDQTNKTGLDKEPALVTQRLIDLHTLAGNHKIVIELQEKVIREGSWENQKDVLSSRYRSLGEAKEKLKDLPGAEASFRSAVEAKTNGATKDYPWSAEDFNALAQFLQRHKRDAEAEPYFRRAYEVSKDNRFSRDCVPAVQGLIRCLRKADPKNEEIDRFQRVLTERGVKNVP